MRALALTILLVVSCYAFSQTLTTIDPKANSSGINRGSNVTLTFNQAVDITNTSGTASVGDNITLIGSQTGKIAGAYNGDNTTTIEFNPTTNFKPGEEIEVILTAKGGLNSSPLPKTYRTFRAASSTIQNITGAKETSILFNSSPGFRSVHVADVDGDGNLDVLEAHSDGTISLLRGSGSTGSFSSTTISQNSGLGNGIQISAGDMDSDGDLDIVLASNATDIYIFQNNGTNNFSRTLKVGIPEIQDMEIVDLDLDGDQDLVFGHGHTGKQILWFRNDGSMSFTARSIAVLPVFANSTSVEANDIDGDGDVDLAFAFNSGDNGFATKIAWYENNGSELFTERPIFTGISDASSIELVDLDKDGDLDLISASKGDDLVRFHQNDGSRNFTATTLISTLKDPDNVEAHDMDGDGDLDLIVGSVGDDSLSFYRNNGSQAFEQIIFDDNLGTSSSSFSVGDINGDGDLEVVALNDNNLRISSFELGEFAPPRGYSIEFLESSVNRKNKDSINLRINNAELNSTYSLSLVRSTTQKILTGTITTNPFSISTKELSSFQDGEIRAVLRLTDSLKNEGAIASDTIYKDTQNPTASSSSGFSIKLLSSINDETKDSLSLQILKGEEKSKINYCFKSVNVTPADSVCGSAVINSDSVVIKGINLSRLPEAFINLNYILEDSVGNASTSLFGSSSLKDTIPPVAPEFSSFLLPVNIATDTSYTLFPFTSETSSSTIEYVITDVNNQSITIDFTSSSFLNLSALADGALTVVARTKDNVGNIGPSTTKIIYKDTQRPGAFDIQALNRRLSNTLFFSPNFVLTNVEPRSSIEVELFYSGPETPDTLTFSHFPSNTTDTIFSSQIIPFDTPDGRFDLVISQRDSARNIGSSKITLNDFVLDRQIPNFSQILFEDTLSGEAISNFHMDLVIPVIEEGMSYRYNFNEFFTGEEITGSGTLNSSDTVQRISGIDLSRFSFSVDFSVTVLDSIGNEKTIFDNLLVLSTPNNYTFRFINGSVNTNNESNFLFEFDHPRGNSTFYSINVTDESGMELAFGDATGNSTFFSSSLDISSLSDGLLQFKFKLINERGDGPEESRNIYKDTILPSGYSIGNVPDRVNSETISAVSFQALGLEVGSNYTISFAGDIVQDSSGIVGSETINFEDLDLNDFSDGDITLSFYLTDSVGNVGRSVTNTIKLDRDGSILSLLGPEDEFQLYPNPANQQITIRNPHFQLGGFHLRIVDVLGKIQKVISVPRQSEFNINVSSLEDGLYFIQSSDGRNKITKPILIKR